MSNGATVRLRHGLHEGGAWQRVAVLRPLCGADELALEESGKLPAQRVTALLAAVLQSIGVVRPVGAVEVRRLTVGDRERLVLALHAASFAPQVECLVTCAACGATVEIALDLREVLAPGDGTWAPAEGSADADGLTLRYRLPTGADQERAAALATVDATAAETALLGACLCSVTAAHGVAAPSDPARLLAALEEVLRVSDPDAEIVVAAPCPECGAQQRTIPDAHALLSGALQQTGSVLADVHRLAAAYHWSETDILRLPTARRRRYLALLDPGVAA